MRVRPRIESRAAQVVILLGLVLCAILTYYPVVTGVYGFTDDYYDLQAATLGGRELWRHQVSEGRPVMGIMQVALFPRTGRVDRLGWLRAINLASLCVLAGAIYLALSQMGFTRLVAAAFALGLTALPCFQICTAWAAMLAIPFSATIAGVAAWLTLATEARAGARLLRCCLAVLMLLASLLVYQPAAMFFWVFVAISLLAKPQGIDAVIRQFSFCFAVCMAAIIAGFIVFKIGTACYGVSNAERTGLTHDVTGKVSWFFAEPLRNALNLDILHHPRGYRAIIVALFTVVGLLLSFVGSWKQRLFLLAVALVLIPLAYVPNLAAADSYSPHRTQVALTPLVAVYFLLSLRGCLGVLSALSTRSREWILLGVVGAWACVSAFLARQAVVQYMVEPQAVEYQLVKSQLQETVPPDTDTIYLIPPTLTDRPTKFQCYDEFGTPSSFKVWAQEGMVRSGLRDLGRDAVPVKVVTITPDRLPQLPPHAAVIDMRQLKRFR